MGFAYYAVVRGKRGPGIYGCWRDCEDVVNGFTNAKFRKFFCHFDAVHYLKLNGIDYDFYDFGNVWPYKDHGHPYYAVSRGFTKGIFISIPSLYKQIKGYKRFEFRKFYCRNDAKHYLKHCGIYRFYDESEDEETPPSKVLRFKNLYLYDVFGFIKVYVDGACCNNGKRGAGAGIGVWFGENHPLNVSRPVYGKQATNVIAETQAVVEALKIAERENMHGIRIYTDSHYIIDCVQKYMAKWKRNGFINSQGNLVANAPSLRKLDSLRRRVFHRLEFVRAHSNNRGNDMADALAKKGAARYYR